MNTLHFERFRFVPLGKTLFFRVGKNLEDFESEAVPHLADLHRAAYRLMGDRAQADDIVQEVFLRAWKSFHQYRKGTNCKAWLFRIMFNCIHDHRRRWQNTKVTQEEEQTLERRLTYSPPVPDHLTDNEVLAALDQLSLNYREVVLLADVEELSYKEIAEALGVPIGTVMSRLSRGRKILRHTLAVVAGQYGIDGSRRERGAVKASNE